MLLKKSQDKTKTEKEEKARLDDLAKK